MWNVCMGGEGEEGCGDGHQQGVSPLAGTRGRCGRRETAAALAKQTTGIGASGIETGAR